MFGKVYERRVGSHTADLEEELKHAEKIERYCHSPLPRTDNPCLVMAGCVNYFGLTRVSCIHVHRKRDQETNAALEEYVRVNQLSVEAEEKASREEFSLLMERKELEELKLTLRALTMDLQQCREGA